MNSIGFVGLGNIGAPMAQRLLGRPEGLVVRDLREEATAPFATGGAIVAQSNAEVAERCSVISVMVLDDAQVRSVVSELLPVARAGTVVAVHSTIHVRTAVELAEVAAEQGVHLVDAPVSGGFMGAHDGRLAVMVGGTEEAMERLQGPFSAFADLVLHVGPAGSGTQMELARNMMHFAAYAAAGEAQRLVEAVGIDVKLLGQVVRHSDAVTGGPGAILVRDTGAPFGPDDPMREPFEHARELGEKDLTLALELASEAGVQVPIATLALNRLATELGL
jgi:3-hydroxyisobutyrate dehydrogenase-like beta-hydroxyacid dehydrogenase